MKNQGGFYDIFVRTCGKFASNIAVRQYSDNGYTCLTYSELYGACEYIAQQLQQLHCNKGVIGLVSLTNYMIPCVIAAAHKCNTTFMFLDPSKNNDEVIDDIRFTVVISILQQTDKLEDALLRKPDKTISILGMNISFYNYGVVPDPKNPMDYSYIAMTSGSTGSPKKIQVPMHCIQPNIDDLSGLFHIVPEDIIYFSTPLTFDPSMVEILLACVSGASLLIAPTVVNVLFPDSKEHSVTVWQTTPSKFCQLSNESISRVLSATSTLRILALGGEPLYGVKRLKELKDPENKTRIFTLYGVTEMSCWACVAELDLTKPMTDCDVPLGKCLSETEVVIEPEPKATASGSIVLMSKTRNCVVLNRKNVGEVLNSLKFIDTGDIGEVGSCGTIYYRGRKNNIIKRFGCKINLQYIESLVMQCPQVKSCSCVWLPKPRLLVVYFCSDSISSQDLSDYLKCKLDDKHWPDKIMRVDSMPLNAHGKVAKNLLPGINKTNTNSPLTMHTLKYKLYEELKNVLKLNETYDQIKHRDFFSLGGTSFYAVAISNSLSFYYPEFGRFILPHLVNPKKTIDQIVQLTQKSMGDMEPKPKKRAKFKIPPTVSEASASASRSDTAHVSSVTENFVEMWSQGTGKCVDASPSLIQVGVNLYVIVGSHSGKVIVVDAMTGYLVGVIDMKSRVEAAVLCLPAEPDLPARGVAGAYDGTLVCFSVEYCIEIWRTNVGAMIKSKAVYCHGLIYVASYAGHIICVDAHTGHFKRTIAVAEQGISADLVLAKNEYVLMGALSGECGSIHTRTHCVVWRSTLESPIFASPALYDDDKYVIFAEVTGEIHCRTVEKGIKVWKYSGAKGNIFSSIYIRELGKLLHQMVFGCHDNQIYSIKVKNFQPTLHWKIPLTAPVYATPCGLHETLIVAASNNGKMRVISAEEGAVLGEFDLPGETFSSPAVYGDYIFIGCRNDYLYGIRFVGNY